MNIFSVVLFVVRKTTQMILLVVASMLCAQSVCAVELAAGIKLVSDKNADASSVENIIKDIIKPGMSDQQKAEAIFTYVVQHFYHHHTIEEPSTDMLQKRKYAHENSKLVDVIKQANVYAHGLCGSQSSYQNELFNAVGLIGRVSGVQDHSAPEVKYDGTWHYLDCDMMGFVRDTSGKIPSIDDIKADKSLLFNKHAQTPKYNFNFDGPKGMWKALSSGVRYTMYGRKVGVHSMNMSLRKGETFTRFFQRQWAPNYRYYCPASKNNYGKTLRRKKQGPSRDKSHYLYIEKSHARFGNWEITYNPDLKDGSFLDGAYGSQNVVQQSKRPFLKQKQTQEASEIILNYYSPYGCAGTAGDLTTNDDDRNGYILEGEFNNDQGEVAYSFDVGQSWTQVHSGGKVFKLDLTPIFLTKYGWQIKLTFKGKKSGLNSFSSYVSGQLSPASLPFVDGSTKMTFSRSGLDCILLRPDLDTSFEEFKRTAHQVVGMVKWSPSISNHIQGNGHVIYKIDAPGDIVRVQAAAKFSGRKGTYEVAFSVDAGKTWITAARQKSLYDEKHSESFWGQSLEGFIDLEKGRAYSPGCIKSKQNIRETKYKPVSTKSILVKLKQRQGNLSKIYGIYVHYKKPGSLPVTITHKWTGGEHVEKIKANEQGKTYIVKGGKILSNISISFAAGE